MSFNNIKTKLRSERGFTIVELLIVIVVIGILAAITIVAYNGVTARANTTTAKAAAVSVVKKAEAYNAENAKYPTTYAQLTGAAQSTSYYISATSIPLLAAVPVAGTPPGNASSILFYTCGSGAGARIGYYDYTAGAAVSTTSTFTAGDASGTCTLSTT